MSADPLEVVVVEDDPKVAQAVVVSLRREGLGAARCATGREALARFDTARVDLVILDLGLPDLDGLEVLRRLRRRSPGTPVLILTARDAVRDRVAGLDAGADDYLVKPFSLPELVARVRALARRVERAHQARLRCADLELDVTGRLARRAGQELVLSPRELDLLHYLLQRQGEVVTRSMLAQDVWKYTSRVTPIDNVIDVQVSRLRDKVDKPFAEPLIHTVRGVGFILERRP